MLVIHNDDSVKFTDRKVAKGKQTGNSDFIF